MPCGLLMILVPVMPCQPNPQSHSLVTRNQRILLGVWMVRLRLNFLLPEVISRRVYQQDEPIH